MKSVFLISILICILINPSFTSTIDIPCYYSHHKPFNSTFIKNGTRKYECFVASKFEVKSRGTEVKNIKIVETDIKHQPQANNDILSLRMGMMLIKFMPKGIGRLMPNLLVLIIKNCELSDIKQQDLMEFPHLKFLELSLNEIKVIEKDLFKFNPKLELIDLHANNIKEIDGNVFDDLNNLDFLSLASNLCIQSSGRDIQEIIKSIRKKCSGKDKETKIENTKQHQKIKKIEVHHETKYWIFVGFWIVAGVLVACGFVFIVYRIIKPRSI